MESERNNSQKQEWSKPELKAITMDATEGGPSSYSYEWPDFYYYPS